MEKQVAELDLIKQEDYQKLVDENIDVLLAVLDGWERAIIFTLLDNNGAMNSRQIHFSLIEQYYENNKIALTEEEKKMFWELAKKSRTKFYNELTTKFRLPSYNTIRNKLTVLYKNKLINKRVTTGKTKELWFITPRLFKAIVKKREEIIRKARKGEVVDKSIANLFGFDMIDFKLIERKGNET